MSAPKRTRPRGSGNRPDRTNKALPPLNAPFPGCCKPYPYAAFSNQTLVQLEARHVGKGCRGYTEPMDLEEWNEDVDRRNAARSGGGGHER